MFKVCFYNHRLGRYVMFTDHRKLDKAVLQARKMTIETGVTHCIVTPDGKMLDIYGKDLVE